VLDAEGSKEFHRLWSALTFLFSSDEVMSARWVGAARCTRVWPCCPLTHPDADARSGLRTSPSDEEIFGHGFAVAGTTLVYLLSQQDRYGLLDFSRHTLNVEVGLRGAWRVSMGLGDVFVAGWANGSQ
jgi:hypothetical protein